MATTITYLLISDADDLKAVRSHPVLDEYGFEHRKTYEPDEQDGPAIRFAVGRSLEETQTDAEVAASELSDAFPEATVVLCEVEERFEQIDRLQTIVFIEGRRLGTIEHGFVFNVGPD